MGRTSAIPGKGAKRKHDSDAEPATIALGDRDVSADPTSLWMPQTRQDTVRTATLCSHIRDFVHIVACRTLGFKGPPRSPKR